MKLYIQKGISSFITEIFVQDSSSTTGAGLVGLGGQSAGLIVGYMRPGATAFTVSTPTVAFPTIGTFAGTATASAITAVQATNAPGLYEFHLPNNALTSTANSCVFMLSGATNMAPVVFEIELTGLDPNATTINITTGNLAANVVQWGAASVDGLSVDGLVRATATVNVMTWNGSAVPALVGGNVPASLSGNTIVASANVTQWGAASVTGVMTGTLQVTVSTNNDKANYTISGASVCSANVINWGAASVSGLGNGGVPIAANVKKNVALAAFEFLMVATPSNLPLTGVKAPATTRSIDGGSFASGALTGFAEIGNGFYSINFGAADLNGNIITLRVATSGASDTFVTLITSP